MWSDRVFQDFIRMKTVSSIKLESIEKRDLRVSENLLKIPPNREDLRECDTFSERGHFDLFIYVVFRKSEKDYS